MRSAAFILLLIPLLFAGCDLLEVGEDRSYPTVLKPLPGSEQVAQQQTYNQMNPATDCTALNRFGLTSGGICPIPSGKPVTDTARVMEMVKKKLSRNAAFTNVQEKGQIRFWDIHSMAEGGSAWRAVVDNQRYRGLRVLNSRIYTWLTGSGVYRISGYWYRNITIPEHDAFPAREAKVKLIGETLTWRGFGGQARHFKITAESVQDEVGKVIVPIEVGDEVALHVAWEVSVGRQGRTSWQLYVDTTTGKHVRTVQLFET